MAEVRWTEEAATWLEDIYRYVAQDNAEAASRVVSGIYERTQTLADFPRLGHRYRAESEGEVRVLLYGHYRIAYLVGQDETVTVLGVFHGALDIERYL